MSLALALLVQALVMQQQQHHDLRDQECGSQELLIGELDGLAIYARCDKANGNRVMDITVRIEPRVDEGPLQGFTLGFCEKPVITAASPDGWDADVNGESRTYVTWRIKPQPPESNRSGAVTLTGFSLVLKPGWMRSRSMDVQWGDNAAGTAGGAGTSTTHDCPR